ncbi:dihydrofolate reductase family protein [Jiangella alba]|uniref:RibD C-terminal domain-containing protein n=1 Tax=Jiangella alba TaxID=561176 RepID=A0A1H5LTR5_9ACTN|nr:dihydrofolate reductase family protein [Jiangella alba]SEE80505.1 RibD C-terminal domain-containing protein [Jiangella alba]
MTTTQKLRVHTFSVSVDGYGAGPGQSPRDPLGAGGERLHDWVVGTRTFHGMTGEPGGSTGVDDEFAQHLWRNVGASIMGRNMFGPVRGPWPDDAWTGWWGPNPPYHHPVFVLTHHPRASVQMEGGTTFHFVTDGIEAARERALDAADGRDVIVAGGAATIRQYLRAGLIDELEIAIAPVLLGRGERLFDDGVGVPGYTCTGFTAGENAVHARFEPATAS